MLLGAPLSEGPAMSECLSNRCAELSRAIDRLKLVSAHDALLLLRTCLSASRILYTLRSSHCEDHALLEEFDGLQRSALSRICNVDLTDDQWLQASMPVRNGGLGIRRVSSLASSAFLASAAGTRPVQDLILSKTGIISDEQYDRSLSCRPEDSIPEEAATKIQRAWDALVVKKEYSELLDRYSEPRHRARLLAASAPHSGDWLHALPLAACGLHMNDDAIRVAVGLRLGCTICQEHSCKCGAVVDSLGKHAFSCKHSSSRIQRHSYVNDVVWRALGRAVVPCVKEPQGLVREDGKRPDGLTLVPWLSGKCATWDVTVVDTLGSAYLQKSANTAASAAETAANRKREKYRSLEESYRFYPVAIETLGPICESAQNFIEEIGFKITELTADPRETQFLYQRLSVAIQRFNAVCLSETFQIFESSS